MKLEELIEEYERIKENAVKERGITHIGGEVKKVFDDNPETALSMDFADLLNEYKRIEKITKLKKEFEKFEMPQRKRITLEEPEKLEEKEGIERIERENYSLRITEKSSEKKGEEKKKVEKEEREVEKVEEKPTQRILKFPEKKEKEGERSMEEKPEVRLPYVENHERVTISFPKKLTEGNPEEEAKRKVEEIVRAAKESEEMDKSEIMRRMVQLTSELFSEKSTKRKKELKEEIAKLKRMLEEKSIQQKGKDLLEVLTQEQKREVEKAEEEIREIFQANFNKIKNEYEQALLLGGEEIRKEIDALYKEDLSDLRSQLEKLIEAYRDYLIRLHMAEVENVTGFGGISEEKARNRIEEIRSNYPGIFSTIEREIKETIEREIPTPLEKTETKEEGERKVTILLEEEGGKEGRGEKDIKEIVDEINSKKEGELLHYLRAKDRESFMKYFTGEITIQEAVKLAKKLMFIEKAKELGIGKKETERIIKEYWE